MEVLENIEKEIRDGMGKLMTKKGIDTGPTLKTFTLKFLEITGSCSIPTDIKNHRKNAVSLSSVPMGAVDNFQY